MNFLRAAISEIVGLFVDDWAFALLLIAWVVVFALAGKSLPVNVAPPLFFGGIAVLTLAFVARKARAARR